MSSGNHQPFNWRHAIYNALIGFVFGTPLLLILGNAYSCTVHRLLISSENHHTRKLAEDLRDFFGNKGSCFPDCKAISLPKISGDLDKAEQELSSLPVDAKVKFPIGVNYPFCLDNLTDERSEQTNLEIIGSVNRSSRQVDFLTSRDILEILRTNINEDDLKNQAIDIITYDPQNHQFYLIPSVGILYLYKDALNSSLNKRVKKNNYDLKKLDINQLSQIN
jgi:hypothetical protein